MSQTRPNPKKKVQASTHEPLTVSGHWLIAALATAFAFAAVCVWGALCLAFWQGSWQLLYHPVNTITRTPAAIGLAFEDVGFATTDAGVPQLQGWWVPGSLDAKYTAIYLHGEKGCLSDTVDTLAQLHATGINVLAFDYRGYGRSHFVPPSEEHWLQDAKSALDYLTGTRHIASSSIILVGTGLGANLALEIAAEQPQLAGVVLEQPLDNPTGLLFSDPRTHLVPAHWLVRDRWDATKAAIGLRVPSLWLMQEPGASNAPANPPATYQHISAPKMIAWLRHGMQDSQDFEATWSRWLDGLPAAH